ncbi:MAG: MFS transporter [Armatimonadota bacterium]
MMTTPDDKRPPRDGKRDYYPWMAVLLLWCICFFNYADRLAIFSVFPVLETEFHFTKTQLGAIGAAFTWVYAAASPLAGAIGDRFPRKAVILGGLVVWSAITGLTGICGSYWHFIAVRGAEGLGEAFYFPASMAYIADYHGPKTRSRATSIHQTSLYIGTIFGGVLAGWMAMHYGWRAPFVILGIAGVVLAAVLQLVMRAAPKRTSQSPQERPLVAYRNFLVGLRGNRTAILIITAFFGANMVNAVFLTWMPTFLKEKFKLDLTLAGLGATVFIQLACFVGAIVGGQLADRWASHQPDARIRLKAIATLIGAPFIWLCGTSMNPWLLIVAMTAFGFCKGLYDANLTPAYYDVIPAGERSSATGLMNLIGFIGAGLGSIAIGVAVDAEVPMSIAIGATGGIYLLIAGVLWLASGSHARRDIDRIAM